MSKYTIKDLAEHSVAIQNQAFNDELDKLAGKGSVFKKIVNTIKGLGTKAKNLGKKLDSKAQQLGKTVGTKTGIGTKTKKVKKGKKTKNVKTMSTKSKRAVGYGTVGAGILGAAGLKELLD